MTRVNTTQERPALHHSTQLLAHIQFVFHLNAWAARPRGHAFGLAQTGGHRVRASPAVFSNS